MKTLRHSVMLALVLGVLAGVAVAASEAPTFRLPLITGGEVFDSKEVVGKKILVVRFQASW